MTFDQLANLVLRARDQLIGGGVEPGSTVILDVDEPLVDLVCFLALSCLGSGTYRPLGTAVSEDRVAGIIGAAYRIRLPRPPRSAQPLIAIEKTGAGDQDAAARWDPLEVSSDLPWLVRSTSGTTGEPKTFTTSRRDMLSRRSRYYDAVGIEPGDRFHSFSPTRFGAARQRVFYALTAGASVLFASETTRTSDRVALINDLGVTHVYCVPMHLEILCDFAERRASGNGEPLLPRLKSIETTSSLVTPALRARVTRLLSPNLTIAYSASEIGHITSTRKSHRSDLALNDIGMPVDGIRIGIFDSLGSELPAGATGRIGVDLSDREPGGPTGDDETLRARTFFPGDLGYISDSGNLIFQGREDDLMIFNGINIFPHEIESSLKSLPEVADAVAFPLPSRLHHQIPCAAVILKTQTEDSELLRKCQTLLGPRSPRFLFALDHFPKNPMGKILRGRLREMAVERIGKR